MALQNRKPFHFLCICWIILSYLGIIIIKAIQNCKYCIWHFNNQGYNVLVTRKRKTEYNPFKFPFITLPSSDLYILSHPSMHKAPQVAPAGLCVCICYKVGKNVQNIPAGKCAIRKADCRKGRCLRLGCLLAPSQLGFFGIVHKVSKCARQEPQSPRFR